jgi:hypothetical protein
MSVMYPEIQQSTAVSKMEQFLAGCRHALIDEHYTISELSEYITENNSFVNARS